MLSVKMKRSYLINLLKFLIALPIIMGASLFTIVIAYSFNYYGLQYLTAILFLGIAAILILFLFTVKFECEFTIYNQVMKVVVKLRMLGKHQLRVTNEHGVCKKIRFKTLPYTYTDKPAGITFCITNRDNSDELLCEVSPEGIKFKSDE